MDAGRSPELTDAAVDRELQALFAVDPSPEFVARVHARVSGESAARRWWWSPQWLAAGGLALAVVSALVFIQTRPVKPVADQVARIPTTGQWSAKASAERGSSPQAVAHRPAGQPAARRPAPATVIQPEIVIDPREASGLRALIRAVGESRIDLPPAASIAQSAIESPPIDDITIAPLIVTPLEEGARQ